MGTYNPPSGTHYPPARRWPVGVSPGCGLIPGEMSYSVYVDTSIQIPGPTAAFDYVEAGQDSVGWGVSGQYPGYGNVQIDSGHFSPFDTVPFVVNSLGNGGFHFDPLGDTGDDSFIVADGQGVELDGESLSPLEGTNFSCPIRDGDGVVAGVFTVGGTSPCNVRLYNVSSGRFTDYTSSVQVLRPIHAFIDRQNSALYVIDAYRIYGTQATYGGEVIRLSLADGTGERINSIGSHRLLYPRAVCVSGGRLYVCDCGNHRVISVGVGEALSGNGAVSISDRTMRFPYAMAVDGHGNVMVRAFYYEALAAAAFKFSPIGVLSGTFYDSSSVGWDDLCSGFLASGLFVADSGMDASNGIHAVGRTLSREQERLFVDTYPVSLAAGWLRGDCMAVMHGDIIAGFSPEGKTNGLIQVSGASSGFIISDHTGSSFTLLVPSGGRTTIYSLRNDIGTAMIKTVGRSSIQVEADMAIHLISSSDLVVAHGNTLVKYDQERRELFSLGFDSNILWMCEDVKLSLVVVFTEGYVHAVDSYSGALYASVAMLSAVKFAYSLKKSRMYAYDGAELRRYTVFASRTSRNSVSFNIGLAKQAAVPGLSGIASQDHEDRIFAFSDTEVLLIDTNLEIVARKEYWRSIRAVSPINYLSSIFRRDGFESPYTMKYSPTKGAFTYVSPSSGCVSVNSQDGAWTSELDGFNTFGMDCGAGFVYVSCEDNSGRKYVVGLSDSETISVIKGANRVGDLSIVDGEAMSDESHYSVSDPQFRDTVSQMAANFTATNGEEGDISRLLRSQAESVYPEFYYAGDGMSVSDRVLEIDSYHFDRSGYVGTKLSIDPMLPAPLETGVTRRAPVFSWKYANDKLASVFAVGYGTEVVRMARGDKGYVVLEPIQAAGRVTSMVVGGELLAFSCSGMVFLYNLMDAAPISECMVCADITLACINGDYLWASSPSRGIVYRMPLSDIRRYDRFQIPDAVVSVLKGPFDDMLAVSEGSIAKLSPDGTYEVVMNMEGYRVADSDSSGDLLVVCATSFDDVPTVEVDRADYDSRLASRRRDYLFVKDLHTGVDTYSVEFGSQERVMYCRLISPTVICIVRRVVRGMLDKSIVVSRVDLMTGETVVEASIDSYSENVSACYMEGEDAFAITLRDGSVVYADNAGAIDMENPYRKKQSSSSSSSSSSSWSSSSSSRESSPPEPPTYVEPEIVVSGTSTSVLQFVSVLYGKSVIPQKYVSSGSASADWYSRVQILVGHAMGGSELWDSGPIQTPKTSVLYGGGNNLQPGQRYYVSVRVGTDSSWTPYVTEQFIMGHFPGYDADSSSSSSAAGCPELIVGRDVTLPSSIYPSCVRTLIEYPGTGEIVISGYHFVICDNGGFPVWDCGAERQHIFTYDGEMIVRSLDGRFYSVTFQSGQMILVFQQAASSSSSSSSSTRPFPDIFDGGITGLPVVQTYWDLDALETGDTVDFSFDAGGTS